MVYYTGTCTWYVRSKLFKHGPAMPLMTRCPAWLINSGRNPAKPAPEGFVGMCACTEPVRTGIGAVCVEYGRPTWPITMLNHTYRIMFCFLFLAPYWYVRTTRYEEAFFSLETQGKRLASLARLMKMTRNWW